MDWFIHAAAAKSLQSCPTLCDPMDCSPPGSPVPGILQARTLEWVVISFSNAGKGKVKVKSLSRPTLSDPMDCSPPGSSVHGIFQARVLEWGAIAFSRFIHGSVQKSRLLSQFAPPSTSCSHPHVHSLCLYLYSCPINRFISTIFLEVNIFMVSYRQCFKQKEGRDKRCLILI